MIRTAEAAPASPDAPTIKSQRRRVTSRGERAAAWVTAALAIAAAVVAVTVPHLGADHRPLPYLAAAFQPLLLAAAAVLAAIAAAVIALRRWGVAPFLAALAAVAITSTAAVVTTPDAPQLDPNRVTESGTGSIRILSWNTNQDDVSLETIAALIDQTRPDIVALPEYFTQLATGRFADLAEAHDLQLLGWDGSAATVLISRQLGTYHLDNTATPPWAGLLAVPDNPASPRIVVAHLQRPSPTSTTTWRQHLDWAAQQCSIAGTIAVGDFNATTANLPNSQLGSCADAATALKLHPDGTWPTTLPAMFGATIDHVFTGSGWRPAAFGVLAGQDHAGSDHRPIFAIAVPAT